MIPRLVGHLIRHSLATSFRRICWAGPMPDWPRDRPVVLYANHHNFFDGYLLWYLLTAGANRLSMTWMEDWDRFPFFAAVGAYPFPADDASRRFATMRKTATRMRRHPASGLYYFPETRLHPPEEAILPFNAASFERFDRLFPEKLWVPIAIHITWWGESLPTAVLQAGTPHALATGDEHERLTALWQGLRTAVPAETSVLLEGRSSPNESWNMRFLRGFFSRYL